jgi:metallo-beta-lactamase class B
MAAEGGDQMIARLLPLIALFLLAAHAAAQAPPSWTRAVKPVRIVGNIYYVGTEELGAYLVAGKEGLILLDVPLEENAELVLRNVRTLGFDSAKIRALLNSHAHLDHAGGLAAVKKKTGAKLYLSARDAELAARGGRNDFAFGDRLAYPPAVADEIVDDGETVRVGDIAMTAVLTPGHTQGCTTWRTTAVHEGKILDVLFLCSLSAPGYKLVGNDKYPHIADDFRRSFDKLGKLRPDVFLANHASFFGLAKKLKSVRDGRANPFIDRQEFPRFLDDARKTLEAKIAKQR